jgi:hypothetical protein
MTSIQLTHDAAARTLRNLVHDQGDTDTFDAYAFILDELRFANNKSDHLQRMLDKLRREYALLVSDTLRDQDRRNQATVRAVAEKGK